MRLPHGGVDPAVVLARALVPRGRFDDAVQEEVSADGTGDEESDDVEGCCVEHGESLSASRVRGVGHWAVSLAKLLVYMHSYQGGGVRRAFTRCGCETGVGAASRRVLG
jgi:hypothetical protein